MPRDKNSDDDFNSDRGKDSESHDSGDNFLNDSYFEKGDYGDEDYDDYGYRTKRIKQRKRKKRVIFSTIAVLLVLVVLAGAIVFGYRYIKNRFFSEDEIAEVETIAIPETLELTEDVNMVIAGARGNLLEPEINSILFSSYNSSQDDLISLFIPVKTLMEIPGFGLESVDEAVGFGGMDLLGLTLKNSLGMEVNHYMLMDIYNVVNMLDGIEIMIDNPITVRGDEDEEIELQKGSNLIDGITAVEFLKYYSGMEKDVLSHEFINQKIVIDAIIKEIAGDSDEHLANNLALVEGYIETDLNTDGLFKIISTFSKISQAKIKNYVLDVSPVELEGKLFYVPDISRIPEIFDQKYVYEAEEVEFTETVKLTILNGAGTQGIAGKVSDIFSNIKHPDGTDRYVVDKMDNADNFNYAETEIILNSSEDYAVKASEEIKNILKVGNIYTSIDEAIESDIIIIIGKDYMYEEPAVLDQEKVEAAEEADEIIRINILNGEGTAHLAATTKKGVEDYFNKDEKVLEVVETKDAPHHNYTQTEIIVFTAREGVDDLAQKLQEFLEVGIIKTSQDNVDNVDITIILGSDYTNR